MSKNSTTGMQSHIPKTCTATDVSDHVGPGRSREVASDGKTVQENYCKHCFRSISMKQLADIIMNETEDGSSATLGFRSSRSDG